MIETFLQKGLRNPLCFDTLKELEEYVDSTLNVDDVVTLLGVVAVGDGLGHQRIIKEADDGTGVILKNGLYANIIANSKLSDKANKAVQIVAGMGIKGGGTLGDSAISLDIESVDDGLEINSDNIRVNIVDDLKTPSSTRPLSARQGMKLDTDKINFSDIVNDLTTGGTNKVASAEMLKVLKQIIDSMGEGGVAKLAAQLKSAEKSRIPSYGTLPAGGSMIVATSGIIIDPKVYIGGELVNPDQYTIDYVAATITLTTPVKYQSIFFIDDNYAPRFKFSVSTVNFLVNAPTLKNKLALGDVIDIQGESDANDGGHHTRVVENTKKLNGIDLGGGLFLNEVPNSRYDGILQSIDMYDKRRPISSKALYDQIFTYLFHTRYKNIDSTKTGKFMRLIPKGNLITTRPVYTIRFRSVGGSRQAFYQDIKIVRSWGEDFKIAYAEKVFPVIDEVHCKIDNYSNNGESVSDVWLRILKCDSTDVALFNDVGVSVDFDIEYVDVLPEGQYNKKAIDLYHLVLNHEGFVYRGELNSSHNLNDLTMMGTYFYRTSVGIPSNAPTGPVPYGAMLEVCNAGLYILQRCTIISAATIRHVQIRVFDAKWGPWIILGGA